MIEPATAFKTQAEADLAECMAKLEASNGQTPWQYRMGVLFMIVRRVSVLCVVVVAYSS